MAGLVGGPAVGCGWESQTGKRRGPELSVSLFLWADLHPAFRTRDDRETIKN